MIVKKLLKGLRGVKLPERGKAFSGVLTATRLPMIILHLKGLLSRFV
jgi:hypothetical protein